MALFEYSGYDFLQGFLDFLVIGDRPYCGYLAGAPGGYAFFNESGSVNQQPCAYDFRQVLFLKITYLLSQPGQPAGYVLTDSGFMSYDLALDLLGGCVNSIAIKRCRVLCFRFLRSTLIARIV